MVFTTRLGMPMSKETILWNEKFQWFIDVNPAALMSLEKSQAMDQVIKPEKFAPVLYGNHDAVIVFTPYPKTVTYHDPDNVIVTMPQQRDIAVKFNYIDANGKEQLILLKEQALLALADQGSVNRRGEKLDGKIIEQEIRTNILEMTPNQKPQRCNETHYTYIFI